MIVENYIRIQEALKKQANKQTLSVVNFSAQYTRTPGFANGQMLIHPPSLPLTNLTEKAHIIEHVLTRLTYALFALKANAIFHATQGTTG